MAENDLARLKIDKSASGFGRGRKRSKLIIAAIAGIVLLLIILILAKNRAVQVETIVVSKVYPSQAFTLLNASGYVVAQRKAAVAAKATGRLDWLGVEEGSKVKQGQVIARLEDRDVVAARDKTAADLENARAALLQARAEQDNATLNFNRNKDLVAKGFVARTDYDASEARYKQALAGSVRAESAVRSAKAALTAAEVAVEYTRIRAPFDAVVLTKDADIGDIVTPLGAAANAKASVVTIADMNSLQVEVDVAESNLSKVKAGQPCEILLDALPDDRFSGQVHMIVPTADRTKASVLVKVRFAQRDPRILPEMSARVAFLERPVTQNEEKPITAVNPSALVAREGKTVAFAVKDDSVVEIPVAPGRQMGELVEVRAGLKPGDKVVLNPPKNLKNGSRISVAAK